MTSAESKAATQRDRILDALLTYSGLMHNRGPLSEELYLRHPTRKSRSGPYRDELTAGEIADVILPLLAEVTAERDRFKAALQDAQRVLTRFEPSRLERILDLMTHGEREAARDVYRVDHAAEIIRTALAKDVDR